jgi:hypothetical protein
MHQLEAEAIDGSLPSSLQDRDAVLVARENISFHEELGVLPVAQRWRSVNEYGRVVTVDVDFLYSNNSKVFLKAARQDRCRLSRVLFLENSL